ncbi:MAG: serine protease [Ferruginibacter sp.]
MEEILLLDAIERYSRHEMTADEKIFFEEMRKNNPEVDLLAVEHGFFLQELEHYSAVTAFKHSLAEAELTLAEEGLFNEPVVKGKAKLVQLWSKYKRTVAIAACIAGFVSLISGGLIIGFNSKYANKDYSELIREMNETKAKVKAVEIKVESNKVVPIPRRVPIFPKASFGATAFLLDTKGYFVTNYHVTDRLKNIIYIENNKGEYFQAIPVYVNKEADLSILKIIDTSFKFNGVIPYSIKKSSAELGERAFTLGYPRNEIVYSEGYLSAKSGNDGDSTAYQFNVSVNHGNSGGPVLNNNGELIAVITAKNEDADGVTFASKSKNIYTLIEGLKKSDTAFKNLRTPSGTSLKGLDRVQQIKKLEDFVFMVVGN